MHGDRSTMLGDRSRSFWLIISMLALSGGLFAMKYAPRVGVSAPSATALYLVVFCLHCGAAWFVARLLQRSRHPRTLLCLTLGVYLVAALFVYVHIDPMALMVDRWSALYNFLHMLFQGTYPYAADSHLGHPISGFPGLFLLALPFYVLGDVGIMQFAAFIGFAFLALRISREASAAHIRSTTFVQTAAFAVLLLTGLPVFVYELVVRSDLFFNMTAVAWLLYLGLQSERVLGARQRVHDAGQHMRGARLLMLAFAWGVLASTRGVVAIPFLLAVFPLLKGRTICEGLAFGAVLVGAFAATVLPFYLWDTTAFLAKNPFIVQSDYIPGWALGIVLLLSVYLGYRYRAAPRLFMHTGIILFGTILGCLVLKALQTGWTHAVWGNGYDISYFAIPMPFLLLHLLESGAQPTTATSRI